MLLTAESSTRMLVALLAEGVDRNGSVSMMTSSGRASPSSRRAWIEIDLSVLLELDFVVALLAEGVDRNSIRCLLLSVVSGRPPRGGRG